MFLTEVGFKSNKFLLKSLLISKYLNFNNLTIPDSNQLKLVFPLFESQDFNKSQLIILFIDFIEQITNIKPIVSEIKILLKKGVFFKCQAVLTKFNYNQFLVFLNEILIANPLLKFTLKTLKLSQFNKNTVGFILPDLDLFFDAYTRRILPAIKIFGWNYILFLKILINYQKTHL